MLVLALMISLLKITQIHVDSCTSTDDLIVKSHVDFCTSTDDICTNKNKTSINKPRTNKPSSSKPSTNKNKPCTNENEGSINENDNDSEADEDDDDDSEADDDDDSAADDSVNNGFPNLSDKTINNLIIITKIRKEILNSNSEIKELISEAENMPREDFLLRLDKYRKLNKLLDNLLNYIWKIVYGENKINNEINSIDIDKKKGVKGYTKKYRNIVNDKIYLINVVSELTDELMGALIKILITIPQYVK